MISATQWGVAENDDVARLLRSATVLHQLRRAICRVVRADDGDVSLEVLERAATDARKTGGLMDVGSLVGRLVQASPAHPVVLAGPRTPEGAAFRVGLKKKTIGRAARYSPHLEASPWHGRDPHEGQK